MACTRPLRAKEPRWPSCDEPSRAPISPTPAAQLLRLQRSAGNRAVGRLLARTRDGSAAGAATSAAGPRRLARQVATEPPKTTAWEGDPVGMSSGCSVTNDGGDWTWNCIHDDYWTPELSFDMRKNLELLDKVVVKEPAPDVGGWRPGHPDRAPWLKPPLEGFDERDPIPWLSVKPSPRTPGSLPRPVGVFYSYDVLFERNQPRRGRGGGINPAGSAALDRVIEQLKADPTLQVRLVGHASSDGNAGFNLRLSMRRAHAVHAALRAVGLDARVVDFVGGADPAGARRLGFGIWAAGEAQAVAGASRPEDRRVTVTFLRNGRSRPAPLELGSDPGR